MASMVLFQTFTVIYLSNDLFYKKRAKNFRSPINNLFIYTEGQTEKVYANDFNVFLNKTNYRIHFKEISTDIVKLISRAEKLIKTELVKNEDDSVWVIFDYEDNKFNAKELNQILDKYNKLNKSYPNKLHIIISNPCFELWFLLHFDAQLLSCVNNSEVIDKLKCHILDYKKGKSYFKKLENKLMFAIKNAKRQQDSQRKDGKDIYDKNANPCTTVNQFVEYILDIQSSFSLVVF